MAKLIRTLPAFLAIALVSPLQQSARAAVPSSNPTELRSINSIAQNDNSPPTGQGTSTSRTWKTWEVVLGDWLARDNDPPTRRGTTGGKGDLCAIAPANSPPGEVTEIWSDRPLLVWQGALSRIEIRPVGSSEAIWRLQLPTQAEALPVESAAYTGEALVPGQTYDWLLFDTTSGDSPDATWRVRFRVMAADQRASITSGLAALETKLAAAGASPETIALERAGYFVKQELWSDVLQTVFAIADPSPELIEAREKLLQQLCGPNPGG